MSRVSIKPSGKDADSRSGARWRLLRRLFFSHFVLCSFLGLFSLEVIDHLLGDNRGWTAFIPYDILLMVSLVNGVIVAALVWLFHLRREKRLQKWERFVDPRPQERQYQLFASLIGFICGTLDVWFFLAYWGLLALTVITLAMVILHIRKFLRKVVYLLNPERLPTWRDVGELAHVYATMLAAYTLITASLTFLHAHVKGAPAAFVFPAEPKSIIDSLYFCIVVMTTLGFGDIYPQTLDARIIVSMECLTSYIMFGLMIGIITRGIVARSGKRETEEGPNIPE